MIRKNDFSISLVIPVYNEEKILEKSLKKIASYYKNNFRDFEIIVVESGSTDNTALICDVVSKRNSFIRVIHEGEKKGVGSALRVGIMTAKKDLVQIIDVDIPFDLAKIDKALPILKENDYVLSYRSSDPRSNFRKIQSKIYNFILKRLLGLKCRQANSAFKVFKRKILKGIEIESKGWFAEAELLYRLEKRNFQFEEIPVALIDRKIGRSTVTSAASLGVLVEMAMFFVRR